MYVCVFKKVLYSLWANIYIDFVLFYDHKTKITLYDTPTQNKIEIFYKKYTKT